MYCWPGLLFLHIKYIVVINSYSICRTLAGSTIMLLTAAWAGSLAIGKCDLNAYDEAIEGSGYGKISCNKQVSHYLHMCQVFFFFTCRPSCFPLDEEHI